MTAFASFWGGFCIDIFLDYRANRLIVEGIPNQPKIRKLEKLTPRVVVSSIFAANDAVTSFFVTLSFFIYLTCFFFHMLASSFVLFLISLLCRAVLSLTAS